MLGWTTIPATVVNVTSLVEAEHDENELRLAFTPMERVAIAKLVMAEIGKRAGRPKSSGEEIVVDRPQFPAGTKTRDIAAKKAGFSNTKQFSRAQAVHDKGCPELKAAVDEKKISLNAAEKIAQLPASDQKLLVENN